MLSAMLPAAAVETPLAVTVLAGIGQDTGKVPQLTLLTAGVASEQKLNHKNVLQRGFSPFSFTRGRNPEEKFYF